MKQLLNLNIVHYFLYLFIFEMITHNREYSISLGNGIQKLFIADPLMLLAILH